MKTRDIVLIALGVAALILLIGIPLIGSMMYGGGMMRWGPMMGGYGGWQFGVWEIIMMFVMLLFWVLVVGGIVLLVVWLIRSIGVPTGAPAPVREDPLEILKRRYAQGEITKEQYDQMKEDLTH